MSEKKEVWQVNANRMIAWLTIGFALFVSPNTNAIMGAVEKRHYGLASSAVGTARVVGQMFSMGIVTLAFALWLGAVPLDAADPNRLITTLTRCFAILAMLCLPGMYFSLARGRVQPRTP